MNVLPKLPDLWRSAVRAAENDIASTLELAAYAEEGNAAFISKARTTALVPSVKMPLASSQSLTTMVVDVKRPEAAPKSDVGELERWTPK